ncbi:Protein of unknown function [Gryllus bimaculatus]|nr:Protein of unknown function [Gryllus bimaculatus]
MRFCEVRSRDCCGECERASKCDDLVSDVTALCAYGNAITSAYRLVVVSDDGGEDNHVFISPVSPGAGAHRVCLSLRWVARNLFGVVWRR